MKTELLIFVSLLCMISACSKPPERPPQEAAPRASTQVAPPSPTPKDQEEALRLEKKVVQEELAQLSQVRAQLLDKIAKSEEAILALKSRAPEPPAETTLDEILLKNGDTIRGFVSHIEEYELHFEYPEDQNPIHLKEVEKATFTFE